MPDNEDLSFPPELQLPPVGDSTLMVTGRFFQLEPVRVDFASDEFLFREGDAPERVYLLIKGAVEILRRAQDGTEHRVAVIEPGRTIGEGALVQNRPHATSARAVGDGAAFILEDVQFKALAVEGHGSPLEYLLTKMCKNLAEHVDRSTDVSAGALSRELELMRQREALSSFLINVLLGLSAYAVAMKVLGAGIISHAHTTLVTGPMLALMAVVAIMWARRSGLPKEVFGLSWGKGWRSALEGFLWTVPALAGLTLLRAVLTKTVPELEGQALLPGLTEPPSVGTIGAYAVYTLLTPIQEFIRSGTLQGPLSTLLAGTARTRHLWAVLVSNALFAITHLHLTLTYGIAAFVFGCLWGVIYARQGSLVGASVSHALVGVWGLYVLGFGSALQHFM